MGYGIPSVITQRALLSEKSIPSDARPRQTASRRPPFEGKYGEFGVEISVSDVLLRLNMAFTRLAAADNGLTIVNVPFASQNRSLNNKIKITNYQNTLLLIVF